MATLSISLAGIEQAIEHLNYRPDSIKQKSMRAISSFYGSEASLKEIEAIDTDTLVAMIWDVGDDFTQIKSKRRNFFSLKSSINADLKGLSQKGLNPEHMMISDTNIFDMTQEAKNSLLNTFTDAVSSGNIDLEQTAAILKAITSFLETRKIETPDKEFLDIINEIKKILARIAQGVLPEEDDPLAGLESQMFKPDDSSPGESQPAPDSPTEMERLNESEEESDLIELDEDQEIEEIELDEDQEIEEIELDEAEELEEVEVDEDQEIEEIELDEDQEIEEIELDEAEELEEVEVEQALDEAEAMGFEDFREKQALAQHFNDTLGEREKKFNAYVRVPKGTYTIGTQKNLKTRLERQPFDMPEVYIGRYPVTNSLFEIFIDQTGYTTTAEKTGTGRVYHGRYKKNGNTASWDKSAGSEQVKNACWYQPSGPGSTLHGKRNHPVVQVSLEDALAYAAWIGRRIPSEAEWESAARTDQGYSYPWGDEFNPHGLNIEARGFSDTCPVDEHEAYANGFGIVDMLGNVLEWTSDRELPRFKTKQEQDYCIAKGGAWNSGSDISISSRALFKNGFFANIVGFRCISDILL